MRRRTLALTAAAAMATLARHARAQSPSPVLRPEELQMHQSRTREFERSFRPEFPPRDRGAMEPRSRSEERDREATDRAARRSMEEQDRRTRASPWSADPWSDGRRGR